MNHSKTRRQLLMGVPSKVIYLRIPSLHLTICFTASREDDFFFRVDLDIFFHFIFQKWNMMIIYVIKELEMIRAECLVSASREAICFHLTFAP